MYVDMGSMKRRGQLQAPVATPNEFGERDTVWQTYATVWCEWVPLTGRELERGRGFGATVTSTITMRYQPNLNITHAHRMYIAELNKTFVINAVIDDNGQHRKVVLYCTELF